ncbi:MAG: hypothetical protein LBQ68_08750, partial [Clostridiales bacterium]|nr:hypothetical protein [Clostridiales bacterium]
MRRLSEIFNEAKKKPLTVLLALIFVVLFGYICYSNAIVLPYYLNSDFAAETFLISRAWREGNFLLKDIKYAGDGIFHVAITFIFYYIESFFTGDLMLAAIINIAIKAAIAFVLIFWLLRQLKFSNAIIFSACIVFMLLGNILFFSVALYTYPNYNTPITYALLAVNLALRMKTKEHLSFIDYTAWGLLLFLLGLWGFKGVMYIFIPYTVVEIIDFVKNLHGTTKITDVLKYRRQITYIVFTGLLFISGFIFNTIWNSYFQNINTTSGYQVHNIASIESMCNHIIRIISNIIYVVGLPSGGFVLSSNKLKFIEYVM